MGVIMRLRVLQEGEIRAIGATMELRRVFGDDVTQCPRCGDALRVLAFITDLRVTANISNTSAWLPTPCRLHPHALPRMILPPSSTSAPERSRLPPLPGDDRESAPAAQPRTRLALRKAASNLRSSSCTIATIPCILARPST